jgi:hypothetical protein
MLYVKWLLPKKAIQHVKQDYTYIEDQDINRFSGSGSPSDILSLHTLS